MRTLTDMILDYGIVQFGRFQIDSGAFRPYRLNLGLLSAYPQLLSEISEQITKHIPSNTERLLCTAELTPVGGLVSTKTAIPLVYSRGHQEPVVRDLVGVYDINHPTLFIAGTFTPELPVFIAGADRVGLKTKKSVIVIGTQDTPFNDGFNFVTLIDLIQLTNTAVKRGIIPERHTDYVRCSIVKDGI